MKTTSQDIFEGESEIFASTHQHYQMFRRLLGLRQIGDRYFECASTVDNRQLLKDAGICWSLGQLINTHCQNSIILKFVI